MDLTPFIPLFTGVLGSLAALGGVWITARTTRRADDKRLALEQQREETRLYREDAAERRADEESRARKQIESYDQIAQMFVGELSALRAERVNNPARTYNKFSKWFDKEWPVQADMRFRRVIAVLTDDDHRLRVTQVCDAILDHSDMAIMEFEEAGDQVEILLRLGFDLASTYARGQEPGEDLQTRWTAFVKQVAEADDWKETKRKKAQEEFEKDWEDPGVAEVDRGEQVF